ncbi:AAA family ATPase [Proteiniclasticum sp.]|uniref:AAA family ATPase n=1 Tax=Proteiniclasticum sp. TaxID=2053595 RepID=UPI002899CC44|nr:AAA family ATPase [Proteiniclasticum sp.]
MNKKNDSKIYFKDLIQWTNVNLIRVPGDFPNELIQYLDPSIEYLAFDLDQDEKKLKEIRLKFRGKDEINMSHPKEVEMYLSSGTVKGINVFIHALTILENGGYLILDELEKHFNKEIATSLLRLFIDQRINKRGAAIIFSTHYPEILDRLSRNDNIYFVRNTDGIRVDNLGRLLKRSDLKKSDVYQSAFIKGTAPQYEAYQAMKRAFSSIVNGEA